jgi:hypothetical protein
VSAHGAPTLHAPVCASIPNLRHIEWFADHRRCDRMLFDGTGYVRAGVLEIAHHRDEPPVRALGLRE